MFGIIRPCRHRLGGELADAWRAQLCGLCLALRDDYGQVARIATNYDGLVVSLLVEAQSEAQASRRTAGRCPLRRMRRADVATGDSVRLAAVVSLALAAARVRDHVDDRDGLVGAVGVRPAARRVAERWVRQGTDAGHTLGFDTGVLVAAMDRQAELEATAGPGSSLLNVTEPTETAVAAAFSHTAVLAGRPENAAPLREVGQLFGRVAHLLDAVEDYHDDVARGKWNPLAATGTSIAEVRTLCDDAVLGIELALAEVNFTDDRLARRLLTREVRRAVNRTFRNSYPGDYGTPHGQQEGINFGNQPMGSYPGAPGEVPPQPAAKKEGFINGCFDVCCCDCSCDCCCDSCCDCGDCCDCS
ncbi:hypothetical protein MKUB_55210 [Mycobacterium kubicae]|uniref:Regulatory protein n=1 Tax=Mycobacterium kubicae TaxID=120959 RepID=A0AAX1J3S9_9MYCO|nr:DUF5685 family protein [Mycobacterium kubicae]MCV7094156.1 hypothetical protein [Mycobacterium kubicae]ORV98497.1 hypothetical protein AWC13_13705 [Mycobacterium kubicae]QNI12592.1 hypothetical protein GAN18_16450 [Mycobacterium kubicae]QPI36114.1 hypothetical protein I2456_16240 [Mycobacterium kubicae]GFG68031.1 hypothetical protein MKUB_55210 [Mycobacterium kubicae]